MTASRNPADPPMAEPGKRPSGADVGGTRSTVQGGVADAADRSDANAAPSPATDAAPSGSPAATPTRARGISAPDVAARPGKQSDDDEEEWRHEPVAPVDESNPLRSLGKAVGDTVTGSGPAADRPPKR